MESGREFDLLILGAGPAGLAAAIFGGRARYRTGIICNGTVGGQVGTTFYLENYPGFGKGTSAASVVEAFERHAEQMGAELLFDQIFGVDFTQERKILKGSSGNYVGRTIILCPGAEPRSPGIPGEERLRGRGVSYCALCDADFFNQKRVCMIGSGDAAIEEAEYLTRFAASVTIIVVHEEGKVDANATSYQNARNNPRIHWEWNAMVNSIEGQEQVEAVVIRDLLEGSQRRIETDGVFIYVGSRPNTDIIRGEVALDAGGYIIVDHKMQTNCAGIFAAGDACAKYLRQVVTAVADGAVAAVAAGRYLTDLDLFEREILAKPLTATGYYRPGNEADMEDLREFESRLRLADKEIPLIRVNSQRHEFLRERYAVSQLPHFQLFRHGDLQTEWKYVPSQEELLAGLLGK